MSQRYAIIDLGTNTFHLLIASKGQSGFLDVQQRQQRPVKLMSNGFTEGQIPQDAYDRGIEAIRAFSRELEAQHAQLIKVLGTSALRSADNALSFLNRAETLLNCPVSLIDGDEEATYIYHGTREAVGLGRAYSLILDIGGGSVEFIIGNKDGLAWKRSLEIGAARLIARFPHDFPMTAEQKQAVRSYLDEQLSPVLPAIQAYQPADLIGASGYFETFVNLEYQEVRSDKIGQMPLRYELTLDRFQQLEEMVMSRTTQELYDLPGMEAFRVPMMGVSSLLVRYLLDQLPLNTIYYANYAMKEGALSYFIAQSETGDQR
jgi:exopolyphosphatase/guanosine-5'-triphosphate,3'-diphosphate pyrophosphatase